MTASTGSAFPPSVDELVPRVRARAVELGETPSRNRVMREFRVGADKARAVLDALAGAEVDPATRPEVRPGRTLHAVDDPASASRPDADAPATLVADPGPEITVLPVTSPSPVTVADDTESDRPAPGHIPGVRVRVRRLRSWRLTLVLLALPAFVAIWSGWVGLGELTGFGPVRLLPGIADGFVINSAITLPIGVEAYAAFALRVWLSAFVPARARRFAKRSAIGALVLGAAGQVAYHLMSAAGISRAPWWVTTLVSCLPVVVLGCAAGLAHLIRDIDQGEETGR